MPVILPDDFCECERGNTWLVNELNHVAYIDLPGGQILEVAVTPENYPGLSVKLTDPATLPAHLDELEADGWQVRKRNH